MSKNLYKLALLVFFSCMAIARNGFSENLNPTPGTNIFTSSDIPKDISANSVTVVSSTITVPINECIDDVNLLNLNIAHTFIDDLTVSLTSPSGTSVNVLFKPCWSHDDINLNFDDSGADYTTIPCPATNGGTYHPFGNFSDFNGTNTVGVWTLTILDDWPLDGGELLGWQLEITSSECPVAEICNNGQDDDGDGFTDCADNECICNVNCVTAEICDDELDNDCDGFIDGFDPDCPCDDNNILLLCEPECEFIPPVIPSFDIEEEWTTTVDVNTLTPFVVGEMDGDLSSSEALVIRETANSSETNMFYIIDGNDGSLKYHPCLLYTSPSPRDLSTSRMPSSA